jgi:hyperosmotically inducible protein
MIQHNKLHRKLLLASTVAIAITTMGNAYAAEKLPKDAAMPQQSNQMPKSHDATQTESGTGVTVAPTSAAVQADARADSPIAEQSINDVRLESRISTTFALSPYLRNNDIKVSVNDGKASLTGIVDEDVNKDLAMEIAHGVEGIKDVDNKIEVKADHVAAKGSSAERSYGEVVDDASISAAVKSKLAWSKQGESMDTKVETKAGKVTLSGTVNSQQAKDHANRLAMNTRGVESVDNKLVVDSSKAKAVDSKASSQGSYGNESDQVIADTWITTKVKSTYIYSSNVDSGDISVTTVNGIVTLSGNVNSGAEQALAIELAKNIRGVESVVATELLVESPVATR